MQSMDGTVRKLYPTLAQTSDDLYRHMSDKDYIDRFASPAKATLTFLFGMEELKAMAVQTDVSGVRKITIPRHTNVKVNGLTFTMQYPIDIRVLSHGRIQIVYDNTYPSPVQVLDTNQVAWETFNAQGVEVVAVHIPMLQFEINTRVGTANNSAEFTMQQTYTDGFFHARAYYKDAQNRWKEMVTTHSDQVFDPLTPTALFKLVDNQLQMRVPYIYTSSGLVSGEFRLDIYTTKGPVEMDLGEFTPADFTAVYADLDGIDPTKYWQPMGSMQYRSFMATSKVVGGAYQLTFEELRNRVIDNSLGNQVIPITNVQLSNRLSRLGYGAVLNVDNVTNRQFKATRALPPPTDGTSATAAGCSIQMLTTSMSLLTAHSTVRDNGDRITILPDTLYEMSSGLVEIVHESVAASIKALPIDVQARRINTSQYLYSPFHYVLDRTNNRFEHRPYYLENVEITSKSFVEENETTAMQVTAAMYSIERVPTGYELTVVLSSSDNWKALDDEDVFVQLSYVPDGQRDRAYMNGELLGTFADERTYLFRITTDYDIDSEHNINLTSFQMYADEARPHPTPLITDFDLVYLAAGLVGDELQASNIDTAVGRSLVPADAIGITRETLRVKLGDSMEGMWASSRTVASSEDYERWEVDVPEVWEETVLKRDATGAIIFTTDAQGKLVPTVLYAKGDVKRDDDGNVMIKFLKGTVKADPVTQQPIVRSTRTLKRQMDMFFMDGVYWFATDETTLAYRDEVPRTIVSWLKEDIEYLTRYLLEETSLFFYPKSTLGQVQAIVREGQQTSIKAGQTFNIAFYLTAAAYRDAALRQTLEDLAGRTVASVLSQSTVTLNAIISQLTAAAGTDIISVTVDGLGGMGSSAQPTVTLLDDSARLQVRRVAVALADGTIGAKDDINFTYYQHTD